MMVGGVKLHLESNTTSARDAQRAQKNLVCTRTHRPTETQTELFEFLLWRYGSAVDCYKGRGSGYSRSGYGISPIGGGHH